MEVKNRKIDLDTVVWKTRVQTERLERWKLVLADKDKEARLVAKECLVCYYADGRLGGCAMTNANCANCDEITTFGSTDVNILCKPCAEKLRLCVHCGADIEYKKRITL